MKQMKAICRQHKICDCMCACQAGWQHHVRLEFVGMVRSTNLIFQSHTYTHELFFWRQPEQRRYCTTRRKESIEFNGIKLVCLLTAQTIITFRFLFCSKHIYFQIIFAIHPRSEHFFVSSFEYDTCV